MSSISHALLQSATSSIKRQSVFYFLFIFGCPVECFDQENIMEVLQCAFWAEASRKFESFIYALKTQLPSYKKPALAMGREQDF